MKSLTKTNPLINELLNTTMENDNGFKYDVFISYSRKDYIDNGLRIIPSNPVTNIMNHLDRNRISYCFDANGDIRSDEVVARIRSSRSLVFLSSAYSNKDETAIRQVEEAYKQGKPILPVCLDSTGYNPRIQLFMVNKYPFDYANNQQRCLDELKAAITVQTTGSRTTDDACAVTNSRTAPFSTISLRDSLPKTMNVSYRIKELEEERDKLNARVEELTRKIDLVTATKDNEIAKLYSLLTRESSVGNNLAKIVNDNDRELDITKKKLKTMTEDRDAFREWLIATSTVFLIFGILVILLYIDRGESWLMYIAPVLCILLSISSLLGGIIEKM